MSSNNRKEAKQADSFSATNKNAFRNYEIISSLEAGIELLGAEVKSIRKGDVNLKESYIKAENGELFLVNCHIIPYSMSRREELNPNRQRRLLLHKKEINSLTNSLERSGLTIIPLRIYFSRGRVKLEVALGKGKKLFDKRSDMKKKQVARTLERVLKSQ